MAFTDRLNNRGSISTGYDIDNSLKVESANSEYFIRTFSSAGTQTTGTVSFWIKRTSLGTFQREVDCSNTSGNSSGIFFESDQLCLDFGGAGRHSLRSEAKLRDTSAWYHCMAVWDTTQSTDTERTKLYINGSRVTSFSTATYPSQNATSQFFTSNDGGGSGNNCLFSRHNSASLGQHTPNGYHAEFHYIDGTAKTPSDFGEFDSATGIWIPIEYEGSHGSNGFYLDFADASDLGDDESGNGNDWTETNITSADQATDTPTNNFAILNPLHYTTKYTITEGGTNQVSSANQWGTSAGSIGVSSGKWYFEIKTPDTNGYTLLGVIDAYSLLSEYLNGDAHAGDAPYGITYYGGNGSIITNGSAVTGLSFPTWTTETMGCALDLDNNKIYFSKSGTYGNSGDPAAGSNGISLPTGGSGTWFFSTSTYVQPLATNQGGFTTMSISSAASDANGYGTFEYAPPSGYYALCTKNLAEYG